MKTQRNPNLAEAEKPLEPRPLTRAHLPSADLPLGRPDLRETRIIKELRPGLTHVHVERGSWGPEGRPKLTLLHQTHDGKESTKVRAGLERLNLKVLQQVRQKTPDSAPCYVLTAGEFDNEEQAKKIAHKIPVSIQTIPISDYETGRGPYAIDIVILDPRNYRGKIVTAWSESIWRASPLEMALKHNAVVATNGSWFEYSINDIAGIPAGISIVDGMWHHEHGHQRQPGSIIAIVEGRHPHYSPSSKREAIVFIENDPKQGPSLSIGDEPPPLPELKWGSGKSVPLDGIDRMPKPNGNELVAMREEIYWNSQFSHGHPEETHSIRMVSEASSGIALVLLATGNKRAILEETKSSWDPVTLDLSIPGRLGLNALFSYNILIENGQRSPLLDRNGSTARTAIGADSEGNIYLISTPVDTPLYDSVGASLRELQDIGEFLGLINFANMDGGPRSSSMVVEGQVIGAPDMKLYDENRRVSDCILIIDE